MPSVYSKDQLDEINLSFRKFVSENVEFPKAIAAVKILWKCIENSKANTLFQLQKEMQEITEYLSNQNHTVSIRPACELFITNITLREYDLYNMESSIKTFVERGCLFINKCLNSRVCIGKLGKSFIRDGANVLVTSFSYTIIELLNFACNNGTNFHVYVTECRATESGKLMFDLLNENKIPTTLILDSAVGHVFNKINIVIASGQAVTASGGAICSLGSYQVSILAKHFNIPFYVSCPSFKFMRKYPISQDDAMNPKSYFKEDDSFGHPIRDYIPPNFISLIFSDMGILTTAAVSEELIKLYT